MVQLSPEAAPVWCQLGSVESRARRVRLLPVPCIKCCLLCAAAHGPEHPYEEKAPPGNWLGLSHLFEESRLCKTQAELKSSGHLLSSPWKRSGRGPYREPFTESLSFRDSCLLMSWAATVKATC